MKRLFSFLLSLLIGISMVLVPLTSSSALASTNGVKDFVTRLYNVCLDRNPDSSGLNDWTNKLINHEATGVSAAYGFVFSSEFQNKQCTNEQYVTYMYTAFFGRNPDNEGLNTWVSLLDNGATRESVFCGFANSTEFDALCASYGIIRGFHIEGQDFIQVGMVNLFVERLYSEILGRSCDSQGMANWTKLLVDHTYSGSEVAAGLVFSDEFNDKNYCNSCYIDTLYRAFMGRDADNAGKTSWLKTFNEGASKEDVFNGFACSTEFVDICNSYGINSGSVSFSNSKTFASGFCTKCGFYSNIPTPPIVTETPAPTTTPQNNTQPTNPVPTPAPNNQSTYPVGTTYILNVKSKVFHEAGCGSAQRMSPANRSTSNESRTTIISWGYKPCGNCKP